MHTIYGELGMAWAGTEETRRLGEHFGHLGYVRFIDGGPGIHLRYTAGDWDEALERAVAFLAEVERGAPHYQAAAAYCYRGLIALARGDARLAESDAERAVEVGRLAGDPQLWLTMSTLSAFIFAVAGDERRADQILAEVFAGLHEVSHLGFAVVEAPIVAWLASILGRENELAELFARETIDSPWLRAGRAVAAGDFRGAADILGEMDARTQEAFFRLRSAEQLVEEGRRAEADEQLHPALAFYRSVGATRYIREGEALLAASA